MTRDDGEAARERAVGNRDARVGRHGEGAADTGHELKGDACSEQRLCLFASASKDKGIAAREPHDASSERAWSIST